MTSIPLFPQVLFFITVILGVFFFHQATGRNRVLLFLILVLMSVQALAAIKGVFLDSTAMPPRLPFIILPSVLIMLFVFFSQKGKKWLSSIDYTLLTYFHLIRIPVEISLFMLFGLELIPESMTFEGRNFDILSGLSAGFIAYYGFAKNRISRGGLIAWNVICLLLVLQVVITGILSAPSPFQQLSFDQPNVGVLMFPFVWLPGIIVPMVIFAHIATLRKLIYPVR